ncbi:hypothetical protein OIU84_014871 [Salix udensis]|uniref:Uncharacterized protein n=1 Tax=Salix udensis TaxID=889485 RepID=A0AAD6NRW0_9ROSI|nr:hypothetical protein OIU84_014871 [Salix udensis]
MPDLRLGPQTLRKGRKSLRNMFQMYRDQVAYYFQIEGLCFMLPGNNFHSLLEGLGKEKRRKRQEQHHLKEADEDGVVERLPRVLNNNPETFGPEHQLISYFALDDVQILKLLKAKLYELSSWKPIKVLKICRKKIPREGTSRVENRSVMDSESNRSEK